MIIHHHHTRSEQPCQIITWIRNTGPSYLVSSCISFNIPPNMTELAQLHHFGSTKSFVLVGNHTFGLIWTKISAIFRIFPRPQVTWVANYCISEDKLGLSCAKLSETKSIYWLALYKTLITGELYSAVLIHLSQLLQLRGGTGSNPDYNTKSLEMHLLQSKYNEGQYTVIPTSVKQTKF